MLRLYLILSFLSGGYSHAEIKVPPYPRATPVVLTSHQSNVVRCFRRYLHRRRSVPCLQELQVLREGRGEVWRLQIARAIQGL